MHLIPTDLSDVVLLEPTVHEDARGFFMESYRRSEFERLGLPIEFVQENHSGSKLGVLRGLHYQIRRPQGKLIRAVVGEVFDVAVDLRRSSATFGQWLGVHLTAENRKALWVPEGFAHGVYTVSEWAEVLYRVTAYYSPEWDRTLRWDDPTVGIRWPLVDGRQPILSEKDFAGTSLEAAEIYP
jgi:dTDP-4-dehydrorhamnose 3,5-epimerase